MKWYNYVNGKCDPSGRECWPGCKKGIAKVSIVPSSAYTYDQEFSSWSHGGRVVTLLPPTSEVGVRFLALPKVGKLVVACSWSAVYSTEP